MSLRTNEQNARFHKLINLNKLDADDKRELVKEVTNGRVLTSRDMTRIEMAKAIKILELKNAEDEKAIRKRMMAKAFNLARELGIVTGEKQDIDFRGLNLLVKRMYGVERFNLLDNVRIRDVITGLEKMVNERRLKNTN